MITFFAIGLSIVIICLFISCLCRCVRNMDSHSSSPHTVVAAPMPQYQYPYSQQGGPGPSMVIISQSHNNPNWDPSQPYHPGAVAYPVQQYGGVGAGPNPNNTSPFIISGSDPNWGYPGTYEAPPSYHDVTTPGVKNLQQEPPTQGQNQGGNPNSVL